MPWELSKGRDTFLPLSEPFVLPNPAEDWPKLRLWLKVNSEAAPRQACECGAMIHSIPHLIRFVSQTMTLEPGDLLVTGTPSGVGRIRPGDVVKAGALGRAAMEVKVVLEEETREP
jgi:acylpyruvate hydrolase